MRSLQCAIVVVSALSVTAARGAPVDVTDAATLKTAIANAKAGDEIILASGVYALGNVDCGATGTSSAPIVVRAASPLGARIDFSGLEGFRVSGAHWHFEGLDIRGVCANDGSSCEHAFHVSGAAEGFVLRGNRIVDFAAQLKVNAAQGGGGAWIIPHRGLVEYNELYDTAARNTSAPVTKLNIDTGDDWIVRGNVIRDFHRADGSPTYGAFMKSGGHRGLFERNLVICTKDETTPGTHIGLSFGGGGTGAQYCAPAFDAGVPCDVEHEDGTMRNNVIVNCSDVGIYVNRGKSSKLFHNTLIGTTGIDYRFDTSSGEARGNVLTSVIRTRDSATAPTKSDNLENVTVATFETMYIAPLVGDLRKKGDLSALIDKGAAVAGVTDDYCARTRGAAPLDLGALEHSLGDCDTTKPPAGATTPGADGGSGDGGVTPGGDGGPSGAGDGGAGAVGGGDGGRAAGSGAGAGEDDGGCGCRNAPASAASMAWIVLGLIGLAAMGRRRR